MELRGSFPMNMYYVTIKILDFTTLFFLIGANIFQNLLQFAEH